MQYRLLSDHVIHEAGLSCTIPRGTIFYVPDDYEGEPYNAEPVTIEWLREYRARLDNSKDGLKRQLSAEFRLLRSRWDRYELLDIYDIREAVTALRRVGEFEDEEFGEFLEELDLAEVRLRAMYRKRA
jgi:hypothetical protein